MKMSELKNELEEACREARGMFIGTQEEGELTTTKCVFRNGQMTLTKQKDNTLTATSSSYPEGGPPVLKTVLENPHTFETVDADITEDGEIVGKDKMLLTKAGKGNIKLIAEP